MQKIKLKTEESGKKLLEAYAPPKWSEMADDDDNKQINVYHRKIDRCLNIYLVYDLHAL